MEQAEIKKVAEEHYPALRFIGLRYTDADRAAGDGSFAHKWADWHAANRFAPLEALPQQDGVESGYIGLMGVNAGAFEYWIGLFLPAGTPVPQGYDYTDLPASAAGVCWVFGKEPGIFWMHEYCVAEVMGEGLIPVPEDARWFAFERYNCPRYTDPDADGNVILDYGIFLAE